MTIVLRNSYLAALPKLSSINSQISNFQGGILELTMFTLLAVSQLGLAQRLPDLNRMSGRPRIINGEDAEPSEFPFMVCLYLKFCFIRDKRERP